MRILDNAGCSAVHIGMYVGVALSKVALHDQLVLLRVTTRYDDVILFERKRVQKFDAKSLRGVKPGQGTSDEMNQLNFSNQ